MIELIDELQKTRRKWKEAKRVSDPIMMHLWERVGKGLKERIEKRYGVVA